MSALNSTLVFEPYCDLVIRTIAEPSDQEQHHTLFSPLGLASALALLCRVSGSESQSQTLQALGMAANSTEQSVEATISAFTDLQQSLYVGGGGDRLQKTESEAGPGDHAGGQLRVWSSIHVDGKPLKREFFCPALKTPDPLPSTQSIEAF